VPNYTRRDARQARTLKLGGVAAEAALSAPNLSRRDLREFYRDKAFPERRRAGHGE
jgi:hypothetical protein